VSKREEFTAIGNGAYEERSVAKDQVSRRGFMRKSFLAAAGATAALSLEERALLAGPSSKSIAKEPLSGTLPMRKLGDLNISRLFMGGNLIGGWAHSRDLVYVSKLVKAYHTDEKIFETLELAEQHGINAILTNPVSARVINLYWKQRGGRIHWFSDCAMGGAGLTTGIKVSIDNGAHAVYVQGGIADREVEEGRVAVLGEALELMKQNRVLGGIGAHKLQTVKACVEAGLNPDFWVKTLHRLDYWSAKVQPENDNIWCREPEETIQYMRTIKKPWIAFKVMAAGAIPPKQGFSYAFLNGADFVCAGMFDFQVVDDVTIAKNILKQSEA